MIGKHWKRRRLRIVFDFLEIINLRMRDFDKLKTDLAREKAQATVNSLNQRV